MNGYNEDEYLMISGIEHFVFCKRQWALIHIEQQWEENYRTADGNAMHQKVHDCFSNEKRGDKIITRAMKVSSSALGFSGECDAVEFTKSNNGISLFGRDGNYKVTPIEYKRGEPKENQSDIMQLCLQAMCLEEMLCCDIEYGYIYYGENKRRTKVVFDSEIRESVIKTAEEMHSYYKRAYTPKVKRTRSCNACSLKNICLPVLMKNKSVKDYLAEKLNDSEDNEL